MGFLSVQSIVPPGVVLPFAGSVAPSGWLLCQGQPVSRTTFAALFASLGTAYGAGDGLTTFNLPDTRGIFLRGAGTNPSNTSNTTTIGTRQLDDFKAHWHKSASGSNNGNAPFLITSGSFGSETSGADVPRVKETGGSETRPANVGVNHIIKV